MIRRHQNKALEARRLKSYKINNCTIKQGKTTRMKHCLVWNGRQLIAAD